MSDIRDQQSAAPPSRQPQFGLRTMLAWVTALSAGCWLMVSLSAAWAVGALLIGLVLFAHVAGNSLGHQLRARSGARHGFVGNRSRSTSATQAAGHFPTSPLQQQRPLHWLMFVLAGLGAAVGGAAGGAALLALYPERLTVWRLAAAAIATGVIGALTGFATGTFWLVILRAWRDATR